MYKTYMVTAHSINEAGSCHAGPSPPRQRYERGRTHSTSAGGIANIPDIVVTRLGHAQDTGLACHRTHDNRAYISSLVHGMVS